VLNSNNKSIILQCGQKIRFGRNAYRAELKIPRAILDQESFLIPIGSFTIRHEESAFSFLISESPQSESVQEAYFMALNSPHEA
jgi:hypothetical protein